jgi:hypothetical protein
MGKQDIFWSHFGLKPVKYKDCHNTSDSMRINYPKDVCHWEDINGNFVETPEMSLESLLNIAIPYLQNIGI